MRACGKPAAALRKTTPEKIAQLVACGRFLCRFDRGPRPDHEINTAYSAAGMPENLPGQSLVGIACDGFFHDAFADHHPKARLACRARTRKPLEPLPAHSALMGEDRGIGMRPVKAPRARERKFPAVAQSGSGYTASRARPLARRARITARPARVFMRTLKPCVFLRRVVDG